jgi:hypothetical protein
MCINTCLAFTGPFSELESCPTCGELRFEQDLPSKKSKKRTPHRVFHTIPLGPQLQALWRSPKGAHDIRYRSQRTEELLEMLTENDGTIPTYDDFIHGSDYIDAVNRGDITTDDMVVVFSIDGAQLYKNKHSDCWISIWIVLDHSPDVRYKKRYVLPDTFIPGPNNPKNPDSFLYPSFHHLAALQREGLRIWDASLDRVFTSYPFLAFVTADGPTMAHLSGFVGHTGAYGCRLYCPVKGCRKPGEKRYYQALLKPRGYNVEGCNHGDIAADALPEASSSEYSKNLAYLNASSNPTNYKDRRRETGISKPSIISGFQENHSLGIPGSFRLDLMHLASLNIPDILLNLWRGKVDCDKNDNKATWDWATLQGDTWLNHGEIVANATPYIPGSFDRPPRNPAEKISSGYKAWEFLMYVFGLGPGLFYSVLPQKYWRHFCKLVSGVRLIHQKSIISERLQLAHDRLVQFHHEFELLYCQCKVECIHFVQPAIHTLLHLAHEVIRAGPLPYYSQWTMERTIGNLGQEIKQPSNPYANLSQRGVHRSQLNALKAMIPDLDPDQDKHPRGSEDVGDGYLLLRKRDKRPCEIGGEEGETICSFLENAGDPVQHVLIQRWARLCLPNGQIARSAWKEEGIRENIRMARNVKVCDILCFGFMY